MTNPKTSRPSPDDPDQEILELRKDLLHSFLMVDLAVAWCWFPLTMFNGWPWPLNVAATLVLFAGTGLTFALRAVSLDWASRAFVLTSLGAHVLITAAHPTSQVPAWGVLVIIAANALLTPPEAFLAAILLWFAGNLALHGSQYAFWTAPNARQILLLYVFTWGMAVLAGRPLKTSVAWALGGWARATEALEEVRERRGTLYRALRALEEATARIQRMNDELVAARREADLSRAMKVRFAASVSHEVRGPLNLILGFSRMMALSPEQYGEPLPRAYRADVATIYRNSQHLMALLDDVLDLSRIEVDRLPLVKDRIDLEQSAIGATVSIVTPLVERKGLYLRQELAGGLPWVLADPVRLRQVLLNLLTNAVRFTERGGITIRTSRRQDAVVVSIQDTGSGIAPQELPRVFGEFAQLHALGERTIGGSGLGLSICKQLIELHGGEIWVESTQGIGSTFSFSLPLPGILPSTSETVRTGASAYQRHPQDICLVVYSNPGIVRTLARHVADYRVVGLPGVNDLLTLTERLHPRAIIAGPETTEDIRRILNTVSYDIPLITFDVRSPTIPGLPAHVVSYLVKPVQPETLRAVMQPLECDGETTILIVDDDLDAVRMLESMLLSVPRSYRIVKAYDGFAALDIMQEDLPDVVFLDLVMPGLDGEQTMRRMQDDERLSHIPVVIVSAQDPLGDSVLLGMPLSVWRRRPASLPRGAKCLQAVLDNLEADYLPGPAP